MATQMTLFPLVGQREIWRRWQRLLTSGRLGHAHLLTGPAGIGKDSLAYRIAAAVNCEAPDSLKRPCGECPSCHRMRTLEHQAVIQIFALPRKTASKTDPMDGMKEGEIDSISRELARKAEWPYHRLNIEDANDIRIASIRKLRKDIYLGGNPGEMKVVIILRAHRMNDEAANALLKILEEPPDHTLFLLTTEYPDRLPDTIRSRCQVHAIPSLPWVTIRDFLVREQQVGPSDAELAARLSQGSVELARQYSGEITSEWLALLKAIVAALCHESYAKLYEQVEIIGDKERFDDASRQEFLSLMILFFRDLALAEEGIVTSVWKGEIQDLTATYPNLDAAGAVEHIETCKDALRRKVYLPLALTSLFLRLRARLHGVDTASLMEAVYS